ncbi:MAG TPA: ribulose-phosphate 3-epimerase [Prolixibacteraceae bacterium]|nr:ribulose-phosphate 3-epimerase [Prolixibacteraceae bacterium]
MNRIIAPSILAANFLELGKEIECINNSSAQWIHFDVMDGVFVPNISFGAFILEQVRSITPKPLDVHLMIINPDGYIDQFAKAGASNITVHYETCQHLHRTIQSIKDKGIMASICLNPHTPIDHLNEILPYTDMVLLMSVNPGFGGQKFIESTYDKVRKLRKMIDDKGLKTLIEVDGGVNAETGKKLFDAGANVLVAGSYIFNAANRQSQIDSLL